MAPVMSPVVELTCPAMEPGGGNAAGGLLCTPKTPDVMFSVTDVVAAEATVADKPTNEPATTATADRPAKSRAILLFLLWAVCLSPFIALPLPRSLFTRPLPPAYCSFCSAYLGLELRSFVRLAGVTCSAPISGQSDMATMVAVWASAVPAEVALPNWNT